MIKIECNNILRLKEDYFNGVKPFIIQRAQLFEIAFKFINGTVRLNELEDFPLNTKSKTALLKQLVIDKNHLSKSSQYNSLTMHGRVKPDLFANRINFIQLFKDLSNDALLKKLILADIDQLEVQSSFWEKAWLQPIDHLLINAVISYDSLNNKDTKPYNAYSLAESLDVSVCPYCNRIYTSTIVFEKKKQIIKPTFDHFFNQARYPFLALSFFNLIPSCSNCNSYLKRDKPFNLNTHLHPYLDGYGGAAVFDYLQKSFHPEKSHPGNYEVILTEDAHNSKYTQVHGNIVDFEIKEIYKSHADIVGEIAVKADRNSPYYAASLFEALPSLPSSKKEFYRFYFSNYYDEKDFNRRPLSKITKDIVKKYLWDFFDE